MNQFQNSGRSKWQMKIVRCQCGGVSFKALLSMHTGMCHVSRSKSINVLSVKKCSKNETAQDVNNEE